MNIIRVFLLLAVAILNLTASSQSQSDIADSFKIENHFGFSTTFFVNKGKHGIIIGNEDDVELVTVIGETFRITNNLLLSKNVWLSTSLDFTRIPFGEKYYLSPEKYNVPPYLASNPGQEFAFTANGLSIRPSYRMQLKRDLYVSFGIGVKAFYYVFDKHYFAFHTHCYIHDCNDSLIVLQAEYLAENGLHTDINSSIDISYNLKRHHVVSAGIEVNYSNNDLITGRAVYLPETEHTKLLSYTNKGKYIGLKVAYYYRFSYPK